MCRLCGGTRYLSAFHATLPSYLLLKPSYEEVSHVGTGDRGHPGQRVEV